MGVVALAAVVGGLTSCGGEMPQVEQTSYETVTIQKQDITIPVKFSAKLKGETDVTITPQVSGQLTRICVTEGDQVKKGQVLFIIDQRDAQLELESAQANLRLSASIRSILQRTHTTRQRHPWHNTGHR